VLLSKANTHGKKFYATGGSHVCSDDFFKAEALRCREDRVKELEEEKKKRKQQTETEAKALAVLDAKASCFENNDYKGVSVTELAVLLAWYNIPKEKMKKPQMVAKWKEIRLNHVPPPVFERWNNSDEEELMRMKTSEVDMSETALGRYAALMKRQTAASVLDFTDEEWANLQKFRDEAQKLRDEASTAAATTEEETNEVSSTLEGVDTVMGGGNSNEMA